MTPKTGTIGTNVKNGNSKTEVKLLSASDTAAGQMRSMRQALGWWSGGSASSDNTPDWIGSSRLPASSHHKPPRLSNSQKMSQSPSSRQAVVVFCRLFLTPSSWMPTTPGISEALPLRCRPDVNGAWHSIKFRFQKFQQLTSYERRRLLAVMHQDRLQRLRRRW